MTSDPTDERPAEPRLGRYLAAALLGWTALMAASLGWNLHLVGHTIERIAAMEARAALAEDEASQRRGAGQGGVHAVVAPATAPGPVPAGEAGRDVVTASDDQALALRAWHAGIWLLGAVVLVLGAQRLHRRVREREAALTRLHEAEAQLAHSRRLEAVGQLAGGMAHDLNNMLAPVLAHAHGALEDLPPDHPVREDLVQIVGAGERARAVLRRVLAFGRTQALEVRPLDLAELIHGLLPILRDVVGRRVTVEAALPGGLPPVPADRGQLETALVNLAANARDAMPDGGSLRLALRDATPGEIRDHAAGGRPRHLLALEVADTGIGMDAAVRARLFEPYFTTKEPGRGTGLGLASVHGVVKQHGGAVAVDSRPGRGTTFRILLPIAELEAEPGWPAPHPAASDSSSAAAASQAP